MSTCQEGRSGTDLRVVLCTIAYRDKLLDRALEVAAKTGFDGVELWGREPHLPETFDETRMRATRKLLQAYEVTPYVLGSYLRFGATKNGDEIALADTLHIGRWLRTPLVRVWASDVGSAGAGESVWKATIEQARHAADAAEKLGMTLVVEMHADTLADTAPSALRLVREVDRGNFRLNFQVASVDDGVAPEQRLAETLPWVAHVHAQNYEALPGPGEALVRAPLAGGAVDYRVLLAMLKDFGYTGCIAVEFAYTEQSGREAALAEDAAFLRSICRDG